MNEEPRYIKLYRNLKDQILSGVYEEGDILPSENELSAMHGITRMTVRQALAELLKEGFIIKRKGKGSIVIENRNRLGLLSFKGFTDALANTDSNVKTRVIKKPVLKRWRASFFYQLSDIEKLAGHIYFERLRFVNNDPVMLEKTYMPNLNLPRFCSKPFVNGSFFRTLHEYYNIEINSVQQDIRAAEARKNVADWLHVGPGRPVLHIYRKYSTNKEEFFIYSSLFCNTEKYFISSNFTQ